jgi:hypothetical protein
MSLCESRSRLETLQLSSNQTDLHTGRDQLVQLGYFSPCPGATRRPKKLVISVWPDADGWKVVCHSPNPLEDNFELFRREADRPKS